MQGVSVTTQVLPSSKAKRAPSKYNDFFSVEAGEDPNGPKRFVCRICSAHAQSAGSKPPSSYSVPVTENTSNRRAHLKRHHQRDPAVMELLNIPMEEPPSSTVESQASIFSGSFGAELMESYTPGGRAYSKLRLHDALSSFIISHGLPFRLVESQSLRGLVHYLNPRAAADMPGRNLIRKRIFEQYIDLKVSIKALLKTAATKFSIIVDGWTSSYNHGFFAVQASAMFTRKNKLEPLTVLLDLIPSVDHAGDKCSQMVLKTLESFGIPLDKVIAIVCDNASANTVMVQKLNLSAIGQKQEILPVYCFAHSIHRVVLLMIRCLDPELECIRRAARLLAHSSVKYSYLKSQIEIHNANNPNDQIHIRTLPIDVKTRWNSTMRMIRHCVRLLPFLIKEGIIEGRPNIQFGIQEILKFLEPFEESTRLVSKDRVSVSEVIPAYNRLLDVLDGYRFGIDTDSYNDWADTYGYEKILDKNDPSDWESDSQSEQECSSPSEKPTEDKGEKPRATPDMEISTLLQRMAQCGYNLLRKHYNRTNDIAMAALILNPQNNIAYCRKEKWDQAMITQATQIMTKLFVPYQTKEQNQIDNIKFADSDNENVNNSDNDDGSNGISQLMSYLRLRRTSKDKDAIETWNALRSNYPSVYTMAMDYLSVPGTSVRIERLFSIAGIICSPRRGQMHDITIQKQLCVREWMSALRFIHHPK